MGEKKKKMLLGSMCITSAVFLIATVLGPPIILDSQEQTQPRQIKNSWDIVVPDDFDSIQEAIEYAEPYDRIFVKSGVYRSPHRFVSFPIIIDKVGITLRGENKNSTIISGFGIITPVFIQADKVNFSGFTLKNNGLNDSLLQIQSDNCIVSDNIFISNDYFDGTEYGVVFYSGEKNSFFNNLIVDADKGVELRGSDYNNIFNNTFENNRIAVDIGGILTVDFSKRFLDRVYYKPSVGNVFKNNDFIKNYQGVVVDSSTNNQFIGNYFDSRGRFGIILSSCSKNVIKENVFVNDGLEIWGNDEEFYNHDIKDNTVNGKPLYFFRNKYSFKVPANAGQIIIVNCNEVRIEKTKISGTSTAVFIAFSNNVRLKNNKISSNFRGVYLYYCTHCSVEKNNFINNSIQAYFISDGFLNSLKNYWVGNYWDDWLGTRSFLFSLTNKRIIGRFHLRGIFQILDPLSIGFRARNIDRRPAKNPIDF